ncbi:MAG TPA: LysM peptidoglycan-binding domain-containing protein [Candidatus Limnocylindrales bacterium]
MTDRGLPIVDGAPACPFVAFEDERDERSTRPDHRHRCFAEERPAPRALAHQDAYCLSPSFVACPTFQDWARREAAVPRAPLRTDPDEGIRPTVRRGRREWASPPPWLSTDASGAAERRAEDADDVELADEADEDEEAADLVSGFAGGASAAAELGFLTPASTGAAGRASTPAGGSPETSRVMPPQQPALSARPGAGLAASAAAWLGADDTEDEAADLDETDRPSRHAPPADRLPQRDRPGGRRGAAESGPIVHGPEWEEPHRHVAYPALRTPVSLPNLSRVGLGFVALVVAAVVLFVVPPMLLKLGASGDATPTESPAASVAPSASLAPTPVPQPTPIVYTVKDGDTLSRIAAKYKTTIADIIAANPQIKNPNALAIGDQITIPTPAASSVSDATAVPDATTVPAASASAP